jgi:3-oxoacyl-[acyl-carrier protein] reductase
MIMVPSIEKKVALVTGGGTGVGKAVCLALAQLDYSIAVNYSRSEVDAQSVCSTIRKSGGKAIPVRCDVGKSSDVQHMVNTVLEVFGRVDCLVCNAGTTHFVDYVDLNKLSDDVWEDIFQTNIMGSFYCFRECIGELKKNKGSVVFVTSVAGITGMGSSIPYAVSKGALNSMTKSLARTFGPDVRVNAVAPGPITTRWLEGHEDRIAEYLKQAPLAKACSPEDVAEVVVYLVAQTKMTTGQILVVDGGRTM